MSGITNYDEVEQLVITRIKELRAELTSQLADGKVLVLKPFVDVQGIDDNDKLVMKINLVFTVKPKEQ